MNFVGVLRLVLLASLEHSIAGLLAAIGRMITKCPFTPGCFAENLMQSNGEVVHFLKAFCQHM